MPQIFDNIGNVFHPALRTALEYSTRADFCIGYFNLRGWKHIADAVEPWQGGEGACARVLIGMEKLPRDELREQFEVGGITAMDNATALRLKQRMALELRSQLTYGTPTNSDEHGLRQLSRQLRTRKTVVKLFLRHPLHAKLYLAFRDDPLNPRTAYVGSSNLTFAGLKRQGELNVDVTDQDATAKLQAWFHDRWTDKFCVDITDELAQIIDDSWARPQLIPPYLVYLKMAYHLSHEARAGLAEFQLPADLRARLLPFQSAAVRIAAHHLSKRGGVLIGDVVGLGKTLMASALARLFQEEFSTDTLIICPPHLKAMWEEYRDDCRLIARILPLSRVQEELPRLRRYRVVLIDESQNLRNREGRRYRALHEYIQRNDSRVILVSATPYNTSYLDLGSQLRLFLPDDRDLGVRPERLLREVGEAHFLSQYQCSPRSIAAFEKSGYPDDWRDLMRLYLVRRTRSFIRDNYAERDEITQREYLTFEDGTRFYFPTRRPITLTVSSSRSGDQYAAMHSTGVVQAVDSLRLPRYGLGNYEAKGPQIHRTQAEDEVFRGLARAGKRLIGFSRTGLFKRLESGGPAFLQSIERHLLRNEVVLHAIATGRPVPVGPQTAEALDVRTEDRDPDDELGLEGSEVRDVPGAGSSVNGVFDHGALRERARSVYERLFLSHHQRFKWVRPELFTRTLTDDLCVDSRALGTILERCGAWRPQDDVKLRRLEHLLSEEAPGQKVLIFTQFADTADYLEDQLKARGVAAVAKATGDVPNPTALAWRFSPVSNNKRDRVAPSDEIRVLIATDVLSEGQNLQDCAIVVNYDLPWAIVKLIQRAGRVDRIGQQAEEIRCYTFMPAEGVERIINLRRRVSRRLRENAEVVGSDEAFFEDDLGRNVLLDLYHEKSGVLDQEPDDEVDLSSRAFQIWSNAIKADGALEHLIPSLPNVSYSARAHSVTSLAPTGVLTYVRAADGSDSLVWIDGTGKAVTESQLLILKAAECGPDEPALPRADAHHELVRRAVEIVAEESAPGSGGQLGRPSGARFRVYERLKRYADTVADTLFATEPLARVISDIYRYPLRSTAVDTLNRQLRAGILDAQLLELTLELRESGRLCVIDDEGDDDRSPQIICSLGLISDGEGQLR